MIYYSNCMDSEYLYLICKSPIIMKRLINLTVCTNKYILTIPRWKWKFIRWLYSRHIYSTKYILLNINLYSAIWRTKKELNRWIWIPLIVLGTDNIRYVILNTETLIASFYFSLFPKRRHLWPSLL